MTSRMYCGSVPIFHPRDVARFSVEFAPTPDTARKAIVSVWLKPDLSQHDFPFTGLPDAHIFMWWLEEAGARLVTAAAAAA